MNLAQAQTLARLMASARPTKRYPEDQDADIHVTLKPIGGNSNDWSARLWTLTNLLDRFPNVFYLRPDGSVYIFDQDRDEEVDVQPADLRWVPSERHAHRRDLTVFVPASTFLREAV